MTLLTRKRLVADMSKASRIGLSELLSFMMTEVLSHQGRSYDTNTNMICKVPLHDSIPNVSSMFCKSHVKATTTPTNVEMPHAA